MKVTLLHHTPLSIAVTAARTCWDSFSKGGNYACPSDTLAEADIALLDRLVHKEQHLSITEHIVYSFNIEGLPRYALQELCRHRLASYSVKSTRYTLKELANEKPFVEGDMNKLDYLVYDWTRAAKYINLKEPFNPTLQVVQLELLRQAVKETKSLDDVKDLVPESYLTNLVWTINIRSFRNFLHLRLSKSAHFKIRQLAELVYDAIPEEHKFLFSDLRKEENEEMRTL